MGRPLVNSQHCALFPLRSSGYQLGCTVAAVAAKRPVAVVHVKSSLQNSANEGTPHIVHTSIGQCFKLYKRKGVTSRSKSFVPLAEVLALVSCERRDGEFALVREFDGDVFGAVALHVQQQLVLVALAHLQR